MTKQIFNSKLFLTVGLLMAFVFINSCKKDADTDSGKVVLLSFGPSGAMHGDSIFFIGNNLNKVTSIELVGATIPESAFLIKTAERIVFKIPQSTQEGYATLKTPDGDVVSKTKINFNVPVKILTIPKTAKPGDNITITGQYLNWVKEIVFAKDVSETTFVSRSLTQLVIKVPQSARTGTLIVKTGGTKPLTIETDSTLNVTLPTITSFSPNPALRGGNLIITGTNLDLVMGVLLKGLTNPVTSFVSKTPTQLEFTIPAAANKGVVTLVAYSTLTVSSVAKLLFVGDLPDLAPLGYAFYIDALENGTQNWGWGGPVDFSNTENVRDGNNAIKKTYDGSWDALSFHNNGVATASYTELTFSIYGQPGTQGKNISVMANWGTAYVVAVQEGKWTEYKIPKASFGNPATLNDFTFQAQGWAGTVYIDHVGLR
jgi:IPT/TIG domain